MGLQSFYKVLKQKEKKDPKRIYLRRLFGLFILGLLHALFLFEGDILVSYSLLGVMLYFLKDKSHLWKRYIIGFWILSFFAYLVLGIVSFYGFSDGKELANKLTEESILNHLGTLQQNFQQQLIDYGLAFPFILLFNVPTAAMMFLVGLWAGKNQIFADPLRIWNFGKGKKRYLFLIGTITNMGYTVSQFYPDHFLLGVLPSSLFGVRRHQFCLTLCLWYHLLTFHSKMGNKLLCIICIQSWFHVL